jgi:hypothetical protein
VKYALVIFSFLFSFAVLPAAFAAKDIGEGYAKPTFKELTQTVVMLGGLDISNPKVSDEYIRLVYCDQYRKNFKNDLAWSNVKKQAVSRILEKKEYFRVLYETIGIFKLGRYDADKHFFPLSPDTALVKVGSMILFSEADYKTYCDLGKTQPFFSPNVDLLLTRPLTLNKFDFPIDEVEPLMARLAEAKNTERQLYGRIRFRVIDSPGVVFLYGQAQRMELRGEVTAIDFFLNSDMTKLVASVPFTKQ